MKIAVIGGGISGLSTAYYLLKYAKERKKDISLSLFEKKPFLGGKLNTEYIDNFIIEKGPNGWLSSKEAPTKLAKELKLEIIEANSLAQKRYVFLNGKLVRIPEDPISFIFSQVLSLKGKLRLALEPFIKPSDKEDETVAEFIIRRLGREALDKLLDPMIAGIFAGNPFRLSIKSAFPKVWELEKKYGSLIKGMLALKKQRKIEKTTPGPTGTLLSLKNGLFDFVKAISKFLKDNGAHIVLNSKIKEIQKEGNKFILKEEKNFYEFDKLILACPAYEASKLLLNLDKKLSDLLSQIKYTPIAVVAFAFKKESLYRAKNFKEGFGFLVPYKEKRQILGVLFDSIIFENRAPKDYVLLRVMLGGARNPYIVLKEKKEIINIALNEIKDILKLEDKPILERCYRYLRGIPHYELNHHKLVSDIFKLASKHNIYLISNAYVGVAFADCVKAAQDLAKRVL